MDIQIEDLEIEFQECMNNKYMVFIKFKKKNKIGNIFIPEPEELNTINNQFIYYLNNINNN